MKLFIVVVCLLASQAMAQSGSGDGSGMPPPPPEGSGSGMPPPPPEGSGSGGPPPPHHGSGSGMPPGPEITEEGVRGALQFAQTLMEDCLDNGVKHHFCKYVKVTNAIVNIYSRVRADGVTDELVEEVNAKCQSSEMAKHMCGNVIMSMEYAKAEYESRSGSGSGSGSA